jgi:hypothetical protein
MEHLNNQPTADLLTLNNFNDIKGLAFSIYNTLA